MAKVKFTNLKTGIPGEVELQDSLEIPSGKAIRWVRRGRSGSMELVDAQPKA